LEVAHLVRPPGFVSECCWMKNESRCVVTLIAVVDACHVTSLILQLVSV
jgi:hypothetical protein